MALDIFKKFATDSTKEVSGVWLPFHGARLKIARHMNRAYAEEMKRLYTEHQKELDTEGKSPEEAAAAEALDDRLTVEIAASTILLNWEDLEYQGEPLSYSKENAVMILNHREFRIAVMTLAMDIENFRIQAEEAQAKN